MDKELRLKTLLADAVYRCSELEEQNNEMNKTLIMIAQMIGFATDQNIEIQSIVERLSVIVNEHNQGLDAIAQLEHIKSMEPSKSNPPLERIDDCEFIDYAKDLDIHEEQ